MPNLNRVMLMGHLCRDPDLRYTPSGKAVVQCSLATNRKWKSESGEEKEEVLFVEWTAWGRTGEAIAQYLKKGAPIYIEGRLKLDQWDDKQTQQKRQKISVIVESFQFLGDGKARDGQSKPALGKPVPQTAPEPSDNDGAANDDSGVPF